MIKNSNFKFCLLLLVALFIFSCSKEADDVNVEQQESSKNVISLETAKSISENVLFETGDKKNKSFNSKNIASIKSVTDEESNILFYVINYEEDGFLILAGDNRSRPILSYSENSEFKLGEDLPEGVNEWLDFAKLQISEIKLKELPQTKAIEAQWAAFENKNKISASSSKGMYKKDEPIGSCQNETEEIGPLLSTIWDQNCDFNTLLPYLSCSTHCGQVVSGCVPIAVAQVMKYYEHPTSYNWSIMHYSSGTFETNKLIRDIHNAIPSSEKNYNCSSTEVDGDFPIDDLLVNQFGYSTASQTQTNYYSEEVKSNLRYGRPVIFSGSNSSTGHMWVCDGFRRSKICMDGGGAVDYLYLHMNWGWGGSSNGWYSYDNFNPGSTYNNNIRIVHDIRS